MIKLMEDFRLLGKRGSQVNEALERGRADIDAAVKEVADHQRQAIFNVGCVLALIFAFGTIIALLTYGDTRVWPMLGWWALGICVASSVAAVGAKLTDKTVAMRKAERVRLTTAFEKMPRFICLDLVTKAIGVFEKHRAYYEDVFRTTEGRLGSADEKVASAYLDFITQACAVLDSAFRTFAFVESNGAFDAATMDAAAGIEYLPQMPALREFIASQHSLTYVRPLKCAVYYSFSAATATA